MFPAAGSLSFVTQGSLLLLLLAEVLGKLLVCWHAAPGTYGCVLLLLLL
jgi:hypothetical protein